uniref:Telomerase reverse transcriptase n=1 Tax=Panagrolaimus superbus TaxID=310955 RepID=A0A914Z0F8_9BILA
MGKIRHRKKCKRSKKIKEDICVEVISKQWITQKGTDFCRNKNGDGIFDSAMTDSKKLLFEMFTKENADAFVRAISYCQLRAFLKDVMNFLFSNYILGERNTQLFINKMAYSFFNVRRDEPVFMENYILRNIELTKVPWLERFSFKTSRILLQCVIKFLCDFFQQLIHKTFHTVFDNVDKMRLYRIEIWKRLSAVFLERFIQAREAKELQQLPTDHYYLMWFVPKSKGFRPIEQLIEVSTVKYSPDVTAKEYLKIINHVLLAVTKSNSFGFGIYNLKQFGHQLRMFAARNSTQREYYCFSGDISNCFPAIEHNFLTESLNEMIPNNGPFIYAKFWVTLNNDKSFYKPTVGYKTLNSAKMNLEKTCKIVTDSCKDLKRITKTELIENIQRYAMKNVVKFGNKIYRCHRGVPQGSALSTLLCRIYLAQMEKKMFLNLSNTPNAYDLFGNKALFLRYVDDYLLLSVDKTTAENIIQNLVQDSKKYGMKLNEEKTVMTTNLSHLQKSQTSLSKCRFIESAERINWCGFAINTVSLTVTPDTSRFQRCHFSIPIKILKGPFGNKSVKQKERCDWVLKKIRQSLTTKRKCMKICRRIYRRRARKTPIFYTIFRCIKNHYLKYFVKRFGLKSCAYFKLINSAIYSFVRTTFKRRTQRVQSCI